MSFTVAFTIQSDTRYLRVLRSFVDAVTGLGHHESFSKQTRTDLKLALIEAVNNAIFHAHKRRRELAIHIRLKVFADYFLLEVEDHGKGIKHMNPLLARLSSHGRGLLIIQNLMDEVISYQKEKKHILQMRYSLVRTKG